MKSWLLPILYLSNNWLSLVGVVLVTTATVFWLFLLPSTLADQVHPYLKLLSALTLPTMFFAGLALIPLGIWRRRRRGLAPPSDLGRLVRFVLVATVANMVLASQFTYSAVEYMDSNGFCGLACHSVMSPEYTSHSRAPHAGVECVRCHIGPGAESFLKAKLSGVRQLVALVGDTYARPIPAPVHNLRSPAEICQTCHSGRGGGERLRVSDRFKDDESNTRTRNVVLMRAGRIHAAHSKPILYRHLGDKREEIPWVRSPSGVFAVEGKQGGTERAMDCLDCHNRPAHTFDTAANAMDQALASGAVPAKLPFAKKRGVELLTAAYPTQDEAAARIRARWLEWYPGQEESAAALVAIYRANVFPQMRVGWGTYPNHLGHNAYSGCFRCHDGRKGTGGGTLGQDCNSCHQLLAMDEAEPKVLTDLGLATAVQ